MSYTPQNAWSNKGTGLVKESGPFLGEVMSNVDPMKSGRLLVYIPDMGGDPTQESSWHVCRYMSPFYGIQPLSNSLTNEGESEQIQSYGMWMNPPDVGVKVLVMFINGDRSRGVWIGCLPEIGSHAAIPGQDAGDFDIYKDYNTTELDSIERPPHSTAETFVTQGLDEDVDRGPVTSSSLRESPSNVFGFNTPGSHSFVMDDGNQEGTSKLVRLRSAAGNQIMMNDDNGFIYIVNSSGTGWVEITPSGNIDVYGEGGINLATKGSVNIHADKDINMHANENIKMVAKKGAKLEGTNELKLHSKRLWLNGSESIDQHSCGEIRFTGESGVGILSNASVMLKGACFKWNSGSVPSAEQVSPEVTQQVSNYDTTTKRAPSNEPWDGHAIELANSQKTNTDETTDNSIDSNASTPSGSSNLLSSAVNKNPFLNGADVVTATQQQVDNLRQQTIDAGSYFANSIPSAPVLSSNALKSLDPIKDLGTNFTGTMPNLASQALPPLTGQQPSSLVSTVSGTNNLPFSPEGGTNCAVPVTKGDQGNAPQGGLGDQNTEPVIGSDGLVSVPGNPNAQQLITYARGKWKNKTNRELWIAALLAQVAVETNWFSLGTEQGSDSYFERYEGRQDLGNTQTGDGKKYRGRGWIQLTGRYNYTQATKALGIDLVGKPERAAERNVADQTAVWYFESRVFSKLSDPRDVDRVSYLVNGGDHGLARRRNEWQKLSAQLL